MNWFSTDSELAGKEYEKIREGLVRYFRFRGCNDADLLADETINRVAVKVNALDNSKGVKKITIFYGFAFNIFREYLRRNPTQEVEHNPELFYENSHSTEDNESGDTHIETECLEKCLNTISKEKRILVTKYFIKEKDEKIKMRKQMADELGITPNSLHVRIYRIRQKLKNCIEKCVKENKL